MPGSKDICFESSNTREHLRRNSALIATLWSKNALSCATSIFLEMWCTDLLKFKKKKKSPLSPENLLEITLKRWSKACPNEDNCVKQSGRQALTQTLTCLVDLIAQGEAGTLPCVVWGELDIERGARRDDGRRCNVPTVLAQQVCCFTVSITDLDVVVPAEAGGMAGKPSVRDMLRDARHKQKPFLVHVYFTECLPDSTRDSLIHTTPQTPEHFFSLLSDYI